MAIGPDELDDATFELLKVYLVARGQQLGLQATGEEYFRLMKRDWEVTRDPIRMQDLVDRAELAAQKNLRDNQDLARPALDARIIELEEKTREPAR